MDTISLDALLTDENELKRHIRSILDGRTRRIIPKENLRESAVLIPICFNEDGSSIVVTKRSMNVEHHKGEISFPGGGAETEDDSLVATALREAYEEIGLLPADVDVLGLLDDHISIMGFHITPVVGAIPCPYDFTINS
nr:CoA pyrophosphatase [Deltaproteobacteria bacterium]